MGVRSGHLSALHMQPFTYVQLHAQIYACSSDLLQTLVGGSWRKIRTEITNTLGWLTIFQYTARCTVGAEDTATSATICAEMSVWSVARYLAGQRRFHALTVFPIQQCKRCVALIAADDSIVIEPKRSVAPWSGPTDRLQSVQQRHEGRCS